MVYITRDVAINSPYNLFANNKCKLQLTVNHNATYPALTDSAAGNDLRVIELYLLTAEDSDNKH